MQKARRHIQKSMLRPLVGAWFQDLFHPPARSAFHLSLTVLVHYRTQDFTCPALLRVPLCRAKLRVRGSHPLWPDFPDRSARLATCNAAALLPPRGLDRAGLGYSPFARHYWGNHCCFLFLRVLRCFSSPRSPHRTSGDDSLTAAGLSHSEIRGSQAVCAYPRLFAAYHVLLRLREPRHPPCALRRCGGRRLCHDVKDLTPIGWARGEYRTRTDDPLLARQAL